MQQRVAVCADELGLAAETVASKKDLSALIVGDQRGKRVFDGWRRDVIGDDLLQML